MSVPMLVTMCNKALVSLADHMVLSTEADANLLYTSHAVHDVVPCVLRQLTLATYNALSSVHRSTCLLPTQQCAAAVVSTYDFVSTRPFDHPVVS